MEKLSEVPAPSESQESHYSEVKGGKMPRVTPSASYVHADTAKPRKQPPLPPSKDTPKRRRGGARKNSSESEQERRQRQQKNEKKNEGSNSCTPSLIGCVRCCPAVFPASDADAHRAAHRRLAGRDNEELQYSYRRRVI